MTSGAAERDRPVLAVRCRCPESERVMARLADGVGDRLATQIYTLCLDLLQRELPLLTDTFDLALCPSRDGDRDWARALFGCSNHVIPERGGDFGERLEGSVHRLRELGYRDVVFIGSAVPSLPLPYLRVIRRILYEKDVVLGPAQEGGVYAFGFRAALPSLREIDWDSDRLFGGLTDLFVRHGLSVGIGPPWYDVDSADALHRAAEDLLNSPSMARQMFGRWVRDALACRGAEDGAVRDSR